MFILAIWVSKAALNHALISPEDWILRYKNLPLILIIRVWRCTSFDWLHTNFVDHSIRYLKWELEKTCQICALFVDFTRSLLNLFGTWKNMQRTTSPLAVTGFRVNRNIFFFQSAGWFNHRANKQQYNRWDHWYYNRPTSFVCQLHSEINGCSLAYNNENPSIKKLN